VKLGNSREADGGEFLVKGHYQPTPSVIVQWFKFNFQSQKAGESIATFMAELHHLSEHCKFGRTLDDML